MEKLKVLSLFAGIGGFDLGLERAGGFETVAFCEIDPFCQKVLAKHWPNVPCFSDVRELRGEQVGAVDLICGGFPCQDISTAGNQAGMGEGTRSGLWSEIVRLTGELRPGFLLVENVTALLSGPGEQPGGWFAGVLGDLAAIGYDAEWHCIPASHVGAPHDRDRVWIIAYPNCKRYSFSWRRVYAVYSAKDAYREADTFVEFFRRGELPYLCRGHDGISKGLAENMRRSLGNSIVPAIAEFIGLCIMDAIGWQANTKA